MLVSKKNGRTNAFAVLAIFIGVVLILAAGYMLYEKNKGKLNPYAETETKQVASVATYVDTVPIPTGFYYVGGTKASGIVISDSEADKEKGDNHESAKSLIGNQYVWIPVENMETYKRKLSNNLGEQQNNIQTAILDKKEPEKGINLWEINFEDKVSQETGETTNIISGAKTQETLDEAIAMYASVKKYGGFYIARYEAGIISPRVITEDISNNTRFYTTLKNNDIMFKAGMYPCNYISWSDSYDIENEKGGVVELARSIYPASNTNIGAISTIVYGVEWDAAAEFCNTSGKTEYGNFIDSEYSYIGKYLIDELTNTYTTDSISSDKEKDKSVLFTSGSSSYTRTNNIYDLAGSLNEWTMEGMTMITDNMIAYGRIVRGGSYKDKKVNVNNRAYRIQNYMEMDVGFRIALYIK